MLTLDDLVLLVDALSSRRHYLRRLGVQRILSDREYDMVLTLDTLERKLMAMQRIAAHNA